MNNQLWKMLLKENLVTGESPNTLEVDSPWYVKLLLAFSGWLAAIFILGFWASIFSRLYKNTPALIMIGLALIIGAFFLLSRKKQNEFLEHLALALSLAGQALLVLAVGNLFNFSNTGMAWLIVGFIHTSLAILMPNFVHRVFSAFFAAISFAVSIYYGWHSFSSLLIYSAILMFVTASLWLNEFSFPKTIEVIQANAYGLVLALITIKGTKLFLHTDIWGIRMGRPQASEWLQPWMGESLLSVVTLFVVWKLLQRSHINPFSLTGGLVLTGILALTLLSLQAQGLIVGVMIILLGFSASNRILIGLGVIALLFFISSYYYLLENTLLEKSMTLLILGIALILGRWLMLRLLSRPLERIS